MNRPTYSADATPAAVATLDASLLFGVVLDGEGGCRPLDAAGAQTWWTGPRDGVMWLHLDRTVAGLPAVLAEITSAPEITLDLLVSNETRPRAYREGDALVTVLRGINFNPGADPEDMIAMQVWATPHIVLTLRRRRLQTPRDVLAELEAGVGPRTAGALVARLMDYLVAKMNKATVKLNDRIDVLEEEDTSGDWERMLADIARIRRDCLALKRHMSPQHEALQEVAANPPDWMDANDTGEVGATLDRLRRYLDDLDVSKESALVLQDDLNNRATNRMNRTMYMLSVVAAIFLPLSFLTGLLGINVGGMPGVNSDVAFWITVGLLTSLLAAQLYVFRILKWL